MIDPKITPPGALRGFTLIEIIIVLAASAIIVGTAVSFIIILNKTGEESLARFNNNGAIRDLYHLLRREVRSAEEIYEIETNELAFYRMDSPASGIKFSESKIVFFSGTDYDTLNIAITGITIHKLAENSELIESISFEVLLLTTTYLVSIKKEYSNASMFNNRRANDNY